MLYLAKTGYYTVMEPFNKSCPKEQGDIGVAVAIAYYTMNDYKVFAPLQDSSAVDLVVLNTSLQTFKVQVKTSKCKNRNKYQVYLKTNGGNRSGIGKEKKFDSTRIDILFVLTEDGNCYSIDTKDFTASTALCIDDRFTPVWKV